MLAVNDDWVGLASYVLIPAAVDGTFIIAAMSYADWGFAGVGGSNGSYIIELSKFPVAASISGRVLDAENGQPLPGNTPLIATLTCSCVESLGVIG